MSILPQNADFLAAMSDMHRHHAISQITGAFGSLVYIGGFLLVQSGRICGNGISYSVSKLLAAICVLSSLITAFNLASFLIQISFIAISCYGIWYRVSGRHAARHLRPTQLLGPGAPAPQHSDRFRAAGDLSPPVSAKPAPEGPKGLAPAASGVSGRSGPSHASGWP